MTEARDESGRDAPLGRLPIVPSTPAAPIVRTRLPAAAAGVDAAAEDDARRGHVSNLYLLTLLSAVDGSLVLLAASGQLATLASAVAVGLTVVAGAGAWLAAQQAFAARPRNRRDYATLAAVAAVTVASSVASVALGVRLGEAMTLHVVPKAAGIVLFLVAAEVAGWRLPRPARVPMPVWVTASAGVAEVALRWTP